MLFRRRYFGFSDYIGTIREKEENEVVIGVIGLGILWKVDIFVKIVFDVVVG